jgi:hypothetical protein
MAAGRGDEALVLTNKIKETDPIFALLKRDPERARMQFAKLPDSAHASWGVSLAEQDLNHPAAAQKALRTFVAASPYEYYRLAVAHARARQEDAAFAALERAYDTHDPDMQYVAIDPLLGSLRADLRFGRLLARMGLQR